MVNQTGWDFDIDTLYGLLYTYRLVDGKYTTKFDEGTEGYTNNRIIDILRAITTREEKFGEITDPNNSDDVNEAIEIIRKEKGIELVKYDMMSPVNLADMSDLAKASLTLKGNSVGFDGISKLLSYLGVRLKGGVTDLNNRVDSSFGRNTITNDKWNDVSGELITKASSQVTAYILDIMKGDVLPNFNEQTLSIVKFLAFQRYNTLLNEGKKDEHYNKFIYPFRLIEQPIVYDYVAMKEKTKLIQVNDLNNVEDIEAKWIERYARDNNLTSEFKNRTKGRVANKYNSTVNPENRIDYTDVTDASINGSIYTLNNLLYILHKGSVPQDDLYKLVEKKIKQIRNKPSVTNSMLTFSKNTNAPISYDVLIEQLNILHHVKNIDKFAKSVIMHSVALNSDKRGVGANLLTNELQNIAIEKLTIGLLKDSKLAPTYAKTKRLSSLKDKINELYAIHGKLVVLGEINKYTELRYNGDKQTESINVVVNIYADLFDLKTPSVYPIINEFYKQGNEFGYEMLRGLFSTTSVGMIATINSNVNQSLNEQEYIQASKYIFSELIYESSEFLQSFNPNVLLGFESVMQSNIQLSDAHFKTKFNQLSLAQQINYIKTFKDESLVKSNVNFNDVLYSTLYGESNIFNLLSTTNTHSHSREFKQHFVNYLNNTANVIKIKDSINALWYYPNDIGSVESTNVQYALQMLARNLVGYAYFTEGLHYGRSISKILPLNLFYSEETGLADAFRNVNNQLQIDAPIDTTVARKMSNNSKFVRPVHSGISYTDGKKDIVNLPNMKADSTGIIEVEVFREDAKHKIKDTKDYIFNPKLPLSRRLIYPILEKYLQYEYIKVNNKIYRAMPTNKDLINDSLTSETISAMVTTKAVWYEVSKLERYNPTDVPFNPTNRLSNNGEQLKQYIELQRDTEKPTATSLELQNDVLNRAAIVTPYPIIRRITLTSGSVIDELRTPNTNIQRNTVIEDGDITLLLTVSPINSRDTNIPLAYGAGAKRKAEEQSILRQGNTLLVSNNRMYVERNLNKDTSTIDRIMPSIEKAFDSFAGLIADKLTDKQYTESNKLKVSFIGSDIRHLIPFTEEQGNVSYKKLMVAIQKVVNTKMKMIASNSNPNRFKIITTGHNGLPKAITLAAINNNIEFKVIAIRDIQTFNTQGNADITNIADFEIENNTLSSSIAQELNTEEIEQSPPLVEKREMLLNTTTLKSISEDNNLHNLKESRNFTSLDDIEFDSSIEEYKQYCK